MVNIEDAMGLTTLLLMFKIFDVTKDNIIGSHFSIKRDGHSL